MRVGLAARRPPRAALLLAALIAASASCQAAPAGRTLEVGPGRNLKLPSDAADLARDGDRVLIDPGEYYDCAVWSRNHLLIQGKGRVVLTDKMCQGKAIFVIAGAGVTVRNLTFQRARAPAGNGAGIRIEGPDLIVEASSFVNNENGVLGGDNPASHVVIRNSKFVANGKCTVFCAHGIYVGRVASLRIEGSEFRGQKQGHHIKSRASRTEVIGNRIEDGPKGTASYLIDAPNGGALVVRGNTMEKGPDSENHSCAISLGEEGVRQPAGEILVEGNKFRNDLGTVTIFVRNGTATPATLRGNRMTGPVTPLAGAGSVSP